MSASEPPPQSPPARCLMDLQDGDAAVIRANGDRKSTEMGLFPGARVVMFRNRNSEKALVIGAGDARFLVSRAIARQVEVAECTRAQASGRQARPSRAMSSAAAAGPSEPAG